MNHSSKKDGHTADVSGPANSDASFVARWSLRKREIADSLGGEPSEAAPGESAGHSPVQPEEPARSELTDADMPAIETLSEESEYQGFMSPGVSEELRKLALRKLFHLPSFNVRDGLDDYDEDFTRFAALGEVMTQDLRHRLKTAEKRANEQRSGENAVASDSQLEPASKPVGESEIEEDQEFVDAGPATDDAASNDGADSDDRERG